MAGSPTVNPKVNISLLPAAIVDAFDERKDLITGQLSAGATATSGALLQNFHSLRDDEIRTLVGTGDLYWNIVSWRDGAQVSDGGVVPTLDVIGLDPNGSGVAATSSIVFSGTATADGTYTVAVVDEERFTVTVDVLNGDTAATVAGKLNAAIGALSNLPFSAGVSTATVTFTASDVGTVGNAYSVKLDGTVAGLSVTVNGWASGANDATATSIFDAIDGRRYQGCVWPTYWNAQLNIAATEFLNRFNVANGIMDGVVFHGIDDTFANNQSAANALNNQAVVLMGNNVVNEDLNKGGAITQPAGWNAANFMAKRAKRLSTNAQIADIIIAAGAGLDAIGGPALASKPYFNTPMRETPVTLPANLYSEIEQNDLITAGFSQYGVNRTGNDMIMGQVVTTYKNDAAGNANVSFKYLNYVDTGSVCREIFDRVLRATYAQHRLTDGELVPGRSITNAANIKQKCVEINQILAGLTLTQLGAEAEAFFSDNLTVTTDLATGTATITGKIAIVTQLRTINFPLSISFTVGSQEQQITF